MRSRKAFTLFHLLVLLAILAILFALLLPALAAVREASLRSQSMNNLRQIALAVHTYHDVNGSFPAGVDDKHFSAAAKLLPYIEQDNLYKTIDFTQPAEDKANDAPRKTVVKTFLNPLDPVRSVTMDAAPTNYLFCAGSKYSLEDNNGAFYLNSAVKLTVITNGNGTSNTLMVGETLKGDNMVRATTVKRQHVQLKKDALKDLGDDSGVKEWKDDKHIAADRCAGWMDGRFLQGTFTGTRKLNDDKPDVDCGGAGGLSGLRSLRDGASVAMCDGSTRYVTSKIALAVWKAIANTKNTEVIPDF
jgi:type II secretory pathway pseudopilin PulG